MIVGIQLGIALLLVLGLWLIIRSENDLEWADLVSSRGIDGQQYTDIDKIGKCAGVLIAFYMPLLYSHSEKFDPISGSVLMSASLTYLGGVAGYSTYLRWKQGMTQTTTTSEPVDEPGPTKTTTVKTEGAQ